MAQRLEPNTVLWAFHTIQSSSYDLRKLFLCTIVNIWNSLPSAIIDDCTVNAFKARLDKF